MTMTSMRRDDRTSSGSNARRISTAMPIEADTAPTAMAEEPRLLKLRRMASRGISTVQRYAQPPTSSSGARTTGFHPTRPGRVWLTHPDRHAVMCAEGYG
jgi:hypothetical protein